MSTLLCMFQLELIYVEEKCVFIGIIIRISVIVCL